MMRTSCWFPYSHTVWDGRCISENLCRAPKLVCFVVPIRFAAGGSHGCAMPHMLARRTTCMAQRRAWPAGGSGLVAGCALCDSMK